MYVNLLFATRLVGSGVVFVPRHIELQLGISLPQKNKD